MIASSRQRAIATAIALTTMLAGATPSAAQPVCGGKDVLAELAATEPAVHQAIMAKSASTENAKALLWKIEKPGVATSHLFGTLHMSDPRVTALSPKVTAALDASKRVVLEIADLSPAALTGAMGQSASLLMNLSGPKLDKTLTPEEFEKVKAVLAKAGMPGQLASLFRPWIVYMLLSMSDCERQRTAAGIAVLDMRLAEEGKKRGLPIAGLETLESQLKAMASIPDSQQVDMLKTSLKFIDRTADLMETMVLMYTRREMGAAWPLNLAIAEKAGISSDAFKGFESEIVIKRNLKMRDGALPLLAEGPTFIAVGALHLIGPTGLVELLRQQGFTVTAVE